MKRIALLILIVFSTVSINAQEENKIGIKAGFNYEMGDIALTDLPDASWDILSNPEVGHAWHFGVYYRAYIDDVFYLQPEVVYSNSTQIFTVNGNDGISYNEEFSNDLVDLNLQLGVELLDFIRAYSGLTGTFNLKANQEYIDAESAFKTFRMGYQIGVGVDISRLTLDIAYLSSFNSDNGSMKVSDVIIPLSQNKSQLQLSIGISL